MNPIEAQRAEALLVAWNAANSYELAKLNGDEAKAAESRQLEQEARAELRRLHSLQGAGEQQ